MLRFIARRTIFIILITILIVFFISRLFLLYLNPWRGLNHCLSPRIIRSEWNA